MVLIVEIDENQHVNYSCENKRMMELSQDLGNRPLLFIRFNPDSYINLNGKKFKSCWTFNKNGLCIVNKDNIKEWESRLNYLKENIIKYLEPQNKIEKTLHVVNLFYDET